MSLAVRARLPRGAVVGLWVGAALVLAALVGGRPGRDGPPLDPRSDGPLGTSALVSLLRGVGAEVELSAGLPDGSDDVALLLQDRLDPAQVRLVLDWVRAGGTLVVTDPASPLTPPVSDPRLGIAERALRTGECSIAALETVGSVNGGDATRFEVPAGGDSCFGDGRSAFVVARAEGAGNLVSLGGAAFATNALLDERANAVLAVTLLAAEDGTTVRFVDAPVLAGGGDKTLADLVPAGVKRGLLQLAVAFVLYASWRAIRLGRPVLERQRVEIAGSELVVAVGRLLSRTRSPGAAADTLREGLRRSLRSRMGVPRDAALETLAAVTAARSGLSVSDVLAALDDREITTDAELVALAAAVASIREEVIK